MAKLRALLRRHRTALAVVGCLALGAVAGAVGLSVQPDVHGDLGPGAVTVDVGVRSSQTTVDVPPLGRLVADSHGGPVGIDVRLDRIDVAAVGDLAGEFARGSDPAVRLRAEIDEDLPALLRGLGLRMLVAAVVVGSVVGLVLPRRRVRYVVATVAGSVAFVGVVGAMAFASFTPEAFDEPRFEGTLAAAPDIVNTVQRHIDDVSVVESRLEALSARLLGLYRSVEGAETSFTDVTLLHVSDLHSNPVGIELVEQTASQFDVDAIIDTGDVTSFGAAVEQLVVQRIARLTTPYYVVPGNHDHPRIRDALVEAGVQVLDPGVTRIEGLRVVGVGDPTYTADNQLPTARFARAIERSASEVVQQVRRTDPDLVAVHNPLQLGKALGSFDVGIAGHVHRPGLRYQDGSVVVEAGSAGATGVGALAEEEDLPYQMQLLQFEDNRLVAVDRLAFEGTDGEFRLERVLIDHSQVDGYPDDELLSLDSGLFAPFLRFGG